jgi:aspartyl-tRNA(Asn)/glutamyl-tRNA(Gln) amidotransferase subunit B
VSLFDTGCPGSLPVLNPDAIGLAIRAAAALNGRIASRSFFDRKHYFYADSPNSYQITQKRVPLMQDGTLSFFNAKGERKTFQVASLHLENDTGKSIYDDRHPNLSLIDLNRSGCGLVEIVTPPSFHSGEDAADFVRGLIELMRHCQVSDADMSEGSLRVDVNVSVRPLHSTQLGGKVEVKNLNSLKALQAAVQYERDRQCAVLENGGVVVSETRGWDPRRGRSLRQRSKHSLMDYRFMPEPDLPPLLVTKDASLLSQEVLAPFYPLPWQYFEAVQAKWSLTASATRLLLDVQGADSYFAGVMEQAATGGGGGGGRGGGAGNEVTGSSPSSPDSMTFFNWMQHFLWEYTQTIRGQKDLSPISERIPPSECAHAIRLVVEKKASAIAVKTALECRLKDGDPRPWDQIVVEEDWLLADGDMTDSWKRLLEEMVAAHPEEVAAIQNGRPRRIKFFVGQFMQKTSGKGDPAFATRTLQQLLGVQAEK